MVANRSAAELIAQSIEKHNGDYCGLFGWHGGLSDIVQHFIAVSPPEALAKIMQKMAQDYLSTCDGFPDLIIVRGKELKLIEVKGEGDQIRRTQLTRFHQLRDAGFDVEVLRVGYHVDPEEIYVVVDVETTGGRPPNDRVTEIGAVKIQNCLVIDEWSSLINPERKIPTFITNLTGISDDMVAGAPTFSEIAESFHEFLDGAVFAAHNVNFDYGFIASEFRRLEMRFKMPKICTCSSMRRHFPGHTSYSLASMCKEYGIKLAEHHRALCDAQAAAELLMLVNSRRLDQQAARAA